MLNDFDILLVEDGDEIEEPVKRKTYRYLKTVSDLAKANPYDGRTVDINQIAHELKKLYQWDGAVIEEVQILLEARRVISITSGGRVKIITGLFQEYINHKNGGLN